MHADTPATVKDLSDGERYIALRILADEHPDIFEVLLDRIGQYRTSQANRAAMLAHPFTRHEFVEGTTHCFWQSGGTPCLRTEDDPRHIRTTEVCHA
jgi:hypothetical protein